MKLQKFKLKDICIKITDGSHYSPQAQAQGYPMFSVKDMEDYGFDYSDAKRISKEDFEIMKSSGCVPQKDDVLIAKDGSYLTRVFVCNETREEAILSSIAIFRCNKELVNPYFLALLFQNPSVKQYAANSCVSGSALPRIILKAFAELELNIPDLDTQNRIVDIIHPLDRKISLNRKANEVLEKMAKQLYDYWFVQFDFPDENGKPYKSSGGKMVYNETLKREIPEGWEVKKIGELLSKYPNTKRFDTKEYLKYGRYPIVDQGAELIVGYTNDEQNILFNYPAVLFGDHSTNVKFLNFPFARGADGTQILYSNDAKVNEYYLYLYVKNLTIPNPGYSRHFKFLKEMPIIIPSKNITDRFEQETNLGYKKQTTNIQESLRLASLRNFLLPMLMNGQVTIKDEQK